MHCPKCGKENPSDGRACCSWTSALPTTARGGSTVIGLVIVVVLLLALLAILLPALFQKRQYALQRLLRDGCGKNLYRISKAMTLYTDDYDGEFPRSAGTNSRWARQIQNWKAANRFGAYGLAADGAGGAGSISSSLYLLVKYEYLTPRSFICKGDSGATEFKPVDDGAGDKKLADLWDFGMMPGEHCSYSYHMPFSMYSLTSSSLPRMAVVADRNPFIVSPMAEPKDISLFVPEGGREAIKIGNAWQHQENGQNVLFMDTHVSFEKAPYCGVDDDNIYTFWDGGDIRKGTQPFVGSGPQDRVDSLLVHDGY